MEEEGAYMRFLRKKRVFALLLIVFLFILFYNSEFIGKRIYPISYQNEIKQSAAEHNMDPLVLAAIIRVETNFSPESVSKVGAMGIMQIMPETAEWIHKQTNIPLSDFTKVDVNIRMGAWYLSYLKEMYDGNMLYAIAAYNAGQGNVNKWKKNQIWDGTKDGISNIPFGETRHYVQKVLYYYTKYQKVYKSI
ncbi:lytic transglycosylase domain-containing protein [Paenibacillus larvae]|nr:lytic transglycosylase domain-containing protein [Paenibacillus larvae]MDR5568345.1 lytic transglycosylase domain-containing protein [Paenibacillus larvae]